MHIVSVSTKLSRPIVWQLVAAWLLRVPRIYNVLQLTVIHLWWTFDSNHHQLIQVLRCQALTKPRLVCFAEIITE